MKLKLNEQGLVPAIAQDEKTGEVLMLGYMSPGSLRRTLASGEAWFYSRSRQELWHKGEVSGNFIKVNKVQVDCDNDTLLLKSSPTGPVCHTGRPTCFFQDMEGGEPEFEEPSAPVVDELFEVIEQRKREAPQGSYVAELLAAGGRPDRQEGHRGGRGDGHRRQERRGGGDRPRSGRSVVPQPGAAVLGGTHTRGCLAGAARSPQVALPFHPGGEGLHG